MPLLTATVRGFSNHLTFAGPMRVLRNTGSRTWIDTASPRFALLAGL